MEQRDYLLREIERIGQVLRAILNRLTGRGPSPAMSIESPFEETKNELLDSAGINLSQLISMRDQDALEYIKSHSGFSTSSIEELALILELLAADVPSPAKRELLQKSLLLLNYCRMQDKTFALERESLILSITETLKQLP
jgi:hypothetical protein